MPPHIMPKPCVCAIGSHASPVAEPTRLAINQSTNRLKWSLREAIEGYARLDVRGIGVWRDKLAFRTRANCWTITE